MNRKASLSLFFQIMYWFSLELLPDLPNAPDTKEDTFANSRLCSGLAKEQRDDS